MRDKSEIRDRIDELETALEAIPRGVESSSEVAGNRTVINEELRHLRWVLGEHDSRRRVGPIDSPGDSDGE